MLPRLFQAGGSFMVLFAVFTLLFSFVWAGPLQNVGYAVQQAAQEYELKAVYLYNFLQFVQWPESKRQPLRDGSMIIGVVGESPFGEALNELQTDVRKSGMSPVRIVYYGQFEDYKDMSTCHLLFVSSSEKRNFAKIVAGLRNAPVLTVADSENFLSSGGMINLVQSGGKIRWTINRAAADRAGFRFNAQLLSMALKVLD
jgi:hypothetical protein